MPIGTIDAGVLAAVDEAGAVQLRGAAWTLDWWIGAEDRWHHPAREASVRQHCLPGAPVVETAVRVPGGDVVARAFGVHASAVGWRGPAVVVEVENRTAVPVALAFALRPVSLDGTGHVTSVRSDGADVLVDGRDRLLLSRAPARVVTGPLGEVAGRLAGGDDAPGPVDLTASDGDAEVAFVVPLPHTAVVRVLLPARTPTAPARRRDPSPGSPWDAPDAESVARGWSTHTAGSPRIVVPEPGWEDGLAWASALLRLAGADEVGACLDRRRVAPGGPAAAVRAAEVAEAMSRLGASDALAPVARGLAAAQGLGGGVRLGDRSDGTVALLHAVGGALSGTSDPGSELVAAVLAPAAAAVRRIGRGRGVPAGLSASALRALRALVPVLVGIGQPDVAEDVSALVARLSDTYATGASDADAWSGSTTSGVGDPSARSTVLAALAARSLLSGAASGTGGHDGAAIDAVRACWAGATSRGRSDLELPDGGASSTVPVGSLGFDVAELAVRTNALLDLFSIDGSDGPTLVSAFDPGWYGHGVEAYDLASVWGPVGFAIRWHGERPALLWQIGTDGVDDRHGRSGTGPDGVGPVLTAPGLDPSWRGSGASGDALLAAPPR